MISTSENQDLGGYRLTSTWSLRFALHRAFELDKATA